MAGTKEAISGVLAAGADFYKRNVRIIVIIALLILLTIVAVKVVRALKRPPNANYISGGGQLPDNWDPTPLTDDIFGVIDGTFVGSDHIDGVYARFNELNDNQMIAVYNKWLDKKYDQEKKYYIWPYGKLTTAVKNGPGYLVIGSAPNQKDVMLANLRRLHLE